MGDDFAKMLAVSSYSKRMGKGEPAVIAGKSGAELAKRTGVSLCSIQMYEQRNKDINKAAADVLFRISRTLGCEMEDLGEKPI